MKLAGMIFPDNNSHFTEPTQATIWSMGIPSSLVSNSLSLLSTHRFIHIRMIFPHLSPKTNTTQSSDFFNSTTSSGLLLKYSPILSERSLQASTFLQSHLCFSLTDSPDCSFATTQKHSTNSLQLCRLFGISNHLAKFPNSLRLSTKSVKLQLSSTRCSPL